MLALLIFGVALWSVMHLFPSLQAEKRDQLKASMGNAYDGVFSLLIVLSIVLIVVGWRNTIPELIYTPPVWGRHLTLLLMIVSIILFAASNAPTRIKRFVRHPMLTAMIVWGVAHLLANGDIRSVVLFGGMVMWAAISIVTINRRDGEWVKPDTNPAMKSELITVVASLVVYGLLVMAHPYFTGMPIFPQ